MAPYSLYYYKVYADNSVGSSVNLETFLAGKDLINQKIDIHRKPSDRNYKLVIKENNTTKGKFYYGFIQRSKSDSAFYHVDSTGTRDLTDAVGDEGGETGETKLDVVSFAFCFKKGRIYVLMEQGYQYPGMGVFQEFLEKLTQGDGLKFFHKHILKEKDAAKLKKIFSKKLSKVVIHLKRQKEPDTDLPVEKFLHEMGGTASYKINFEVSLQEESKSVGVSGFLTKFFGVNDVDSLLGVDFAALMSSFKLDFFDEQSPENVETENILRFFEGEEIDSEKTDIQKCETLGKRVCDCLIDKIDVISDESK